MSSKDRKHPYGINHRGVVLGCGVSTVDVELGIECRHNPQNCVELWVVLVQKNRRQILLAHNGAVGKLCEGHTLYLPQLIEAVNYFRLGLCRIHSERSLSIAACNICRLVSVVCFSAVE